MYQRNRSLFYIVHLADNNLFYSKCSSAMHEPNTDTLRGKKHLWSYKYTRINTRLISLIIGPSDVFIAMV